MSDLRLYLVKANRADYHDFDCAVVYAASPGDALEIVRAEADKDGLSDAAGVWEPPDDFAGLTAAEVPLVRGPVLGHAKPC